MNRVWNGPVRAERPGNPESTVEMQHATMGMLLALQDWEGDGDAFLTLDRAAEAADWGDSLAEATWQGAYAMLAQINSDLARILPGMAEYERLVAA